MTNIFGLLVVKNESHRYLDAMLKHVSWYLDDIMIVDDQSVDDTVDIASRYAKVEVRPDHIPSFLENESAFREFAWKELEERFSPSQNDWILSIDADEFIIADHPRDDLLDLTKTSDVGVNIPIPELWTLDPPMIRVDGFWNKNMSPRFFRYMPGGTFSGKKMGCPPYPTYVKSGMVSNHLEILHVGYADQSDLEEKYSRYSSITQGHSSSHIKSIILNPKLAKYNRPIPDIYRNKND